MGWEREGIHRKMETVSNVLVLGVGSEFGDVILLDVTIV